jgi:hypothetical protein
MYKKIKQTIWKTTTAKVITTLVTLFMAFTGYKVLNPTSCTGLTCGPVSYVENFVNKTADATRNVLGMEASKTWKTRAIELGSGAKNFVVENRKAIGIVVVLAGTGAGAYYLGYAGASAVAGKAFAVIATVTKAVWAAGEGAVQSIAKDVRGAGGSAAKSDAIS